MSELLPIALSLLTAYAAACGTWGGEPGAPLWLSWPLPIWNRIANDWRRPQLRPDRAKIARLERELGIGQDDKPTA
ncbi:hypothetical protein OG352_06275 [Streptomyces sp. NBC_01485]|uniref:hypothetical protein n=1 Tax=Streptomyces sp. NBC_01485 TaxID=2903884 RepID=UPI002E2EC3F9|nr:hypothetical protein [Streptomyces sp. NBC_01485]